MTPLSPARRAAEEFASMVDGTREDAADRYGDLLTCVELLRVQEMPAPRPDFVANLRTQLMDAADTALIPSEPTRLAPVVSFNDAAKRRQRRISVAAAAFVVVGGTAGVAAASDNALPGDPLYPLKRGIESALVTVNATDAGKGQDLLRQANTRLDEVDHLIADDASADKIDRTLASFSDSATAGAEKLFMSYQREGDPQDISSLRAMLASQLKTLDALDDQAPSQSKDAFAAARARLTDLDDQAQGLCNYCGPTAFSQSSAPALTSLLVGPANSSAGAADADSDLAKQAGQVAATTPPKIGTGPSAGPTPTPAPGAPSGTPNIDPNQATGPVKGLVTGLTGGVSALLGEVSSATGGALDPLTNLLIGTLDGVDKVVTGNK